VTTKAVRQKTIAALLAEEAVTSQEQIVDHLASQDITATQATVSRDLEDLGAIKVRMPGGVAAYAIPDHPHEQVLPAGHLRRVFTEWGVGADASANIVVLRTLPGSAHVVEVLGTVAGDDTLMVVAAAGHEGEDVAELFRSYADLG
jgi:transcriptional regulator of arginine metabolism